MDKETEFFKFLCVKVSRKLLLLIPVKSIFLIERLWDWHMDSLQLVKDVHMDILQLEKDVHMDSLQLDKDVIVHNPHG